MPPERQPSRLPNLLGRCSFASRCYRPAAYLRRAGTCWRPTCESHAVGHDLAVLVPDTTAAFPAYGDLAVTWAFLPVHDDMTLGEVAERTTRRLIAAATGRGRQLHSSSALDLHRDPYRSPPSAVVTSLAEEVRGQHGRAWYAVRAWARSRSGPLSTGVVPTVDGVEVSRGA